MQLQVSTPPADEASLLDAAHRGGKAAWLRANISLLIGITLVLGLAFATIVGPFLARYDPNTGNIIEGVLGPSHAHLMGTDAEGRDVFTRILYGARYALG